MLFLGNNPVYCCTGTFGLMVFLTVCASYAYRVNARRPNDDPKKRDFKFGAIFLVPFTWPFLLLALCTIFVLRALVYMAFLILFTIALLVIRKPLLLVRLAKIATTIGDKLLEANTFLIKVFRGGTLENP